MAVKWLSLMLLLIVSLTRSGASFDPEKDSDNPCIMELCCPIFNSMTKSNYRDFLNHEIEPFPDDFCQCRLINKNIPCSDPIHDIQDELKEICIVDNSMQEQISYSNYCSSTIKLEIRDNVNLGGNQSLIQICLKNDSESQVDVMCSEFNFNGIVSVVNIHEIWNKVISDAYILKSSRVKRDDVLTTVPFQEFFENKNSNFVTDILNQKRNNLKERSQLDLETRSNVTILLESLTKLMKTLNSNLIKVHNDLKNIIPTNNSPIFLPSEINKSANKRLPIWSNILPTTYPFLANYTTKAYTKELPVFNYDFRTTSPPSGNANLESDDYSSRITALVSEMLNRNSEAPSKIYNFLKEHIYSSNSGKKTKETLVIPRENEMINNEDIPRENRKQRNKEKSGVPLDFEANGRLENSVSPMEYHVDIGDSIYPESKNHDTRVEDFDDADLYNLNFDTILDYPQYDDQVEVSDRLQDLMPHELAALKDKKLRGFRVRRHRKFYVNNTSRNIFDSIKMVKSNNFTAENATNETSTYTEHSIGVNEYLTLMQIKEKHLQVNDNSTRSTDGSSYRTGRKLSTKALGNNPMQVSLNGNISAGYETEANRNDITIQNSEVEIIPGNCSQSGNLVLRDCRTTIQICTSLDAKFSNLLWEKQLKNAGYECYVFIEVVPFWSGRISIEMEGVALNDTRIDCSSFIVEFTTSFGTNHSPEILRLCGSGFSLTRTALLEGLREPGRMVLKFSSPASNSDGIVVQIRLRAESAKSGENRQSSNDLRRGKETVETEMQEQPVQMWQFNGDRNLQINASNGDTAIEIEFPTDEKLSLLIKVPQMQEYQEIHPNSLPEDLPMSSWPGSVKDSLRSTPLNDGQGAQKNPSETLLVRGTALTTHVVVFILGCVIALLAVWGVKPCQPSRKAFALGEAEGERV